MTRLLRTIGRSLLLCYLTVVVSAATVYLLVMSPLLFISQTAYLRFACAVQASFLANVIFALNMVMGITVRATGVRPPSEPALVVSNHITQDYFAIYSLNICTGMLGYVRPMIKRITKYAPGWGWGMALCRWPFVSRNYERDVVELRQTFALYKACRIPVQVWLFAEGTRRSPQKIAESKAVAASKNLPQWDRVLLPRHRGFILALTSLQGVISAVHDTTIAYAGWDSLTPRFPMLVGSDYHLREHCIHINTDRVPVESIPSDDEGRRAWLIERFARKEQLLKEFEVTGRFPGEPIELTFSRVKIVAHVILWLFLTPIATILPFYLIM